MGAATLSDLAVYWRMPAVDARARVAELLDAGALQAVTVDGWRTQAFVPGGVVVPRRVEAATLLVPFDPLLWERPRVARLFGFDLKLEIYTPAAQRVYGYYVLPFLLGEDLVARVDLKTARDTGTLQVRGAFCEPGRDPAMIAGPLAAEVRALAGWLGCARVEVADHGDLAAALAAAVR
jgi:uncharacterized protein YcaQ